MYDETVNKDLNTWKRYETKMAKNKLDLQEIQIDLDDVVLSGTQDSIDPMSVLIPRFQIMFDDVNFQIDMIRACKADRFQEEGLDNSVNIYDTYCS